MKPPTPRNRPTRYLITYIAAIICSILTKIKVEGKENLPKKGPFILAPNHIDHSDPVAIAYAIKKPITFLMAEDLENVPSVQRIIPWAYGVVLVNRKKPKLSTFKIMNKQIQGGEIICIFPEGTSINPNLIEGKNGAAMFASQHNIPIIPVAIRGTNFVLEKLKKLKRQRVTVVFGKPIEETAKFLNNNDNLTRKTMQAISKMLNEPEYLC